MARTHLKPKLYKIDSKGKVRVWWIEYDEEKYRTHSGIDRGKIVISGWTYPTPKNEGRSNATTVEQQVVLEVTAEYVKKQAQGKYHSTKEATSKGASFIEPMLAGKYDPKKHTDFPYYSQPKLDGIRALISKDGIQSRQGKPIVSCPHILEELDDFFKEYPDFILDGELYNHELKDQFEELVSLVRKQKPTMKDFIATAVNVQYHIYDVIPGGNWKHLGFGGRAQFLMDEFEPDDGIIHRVETNIVSNVKEVDGHLEKYLIQGYEGQMLRSQNAPYERKRSKNLLKHKEFEDAEFEIVAIHEGEGNWGGYAKSIDIRLEDGSVQSSGIRGNQAKMAEVLEWAGEYTSATVRYQNRTADGKLRFPVAVALWKGERDL
jgi:ATP-dependent DNA ligase